MSNEQALKFAEYLHRRSKLVLGYLNSGHDKSLNNLFKLELQSLEVNRGNM